MSTGPGLIDADGSGSLNPIFGPSLSKAHEFVEAFAGFVRGFETCLMVIVEMGGDGANGTAVDAVVQGDIGIFDPRNRKPILLAAFGDIGRDGQPVFRPGLIPDGWFGGGKKFFRDVVEVEPARI